jgi:CheY-like chemotaxis protein
MAASAPILCVEDNEKYLRLRKAVLAHAGYVVFSATTPAEAMEILREAPVCLVLSDHMLRGTTGTALAREMKKIKPEVPILLSSGSTPETMQHIDGFINKSEPVPKFLRMIRDFVGRYCE